jgi:hypothetical protein
MTYWLVKGVLCHLHVFVYFLCFLLLLISSLIPLWKLFQFSFFISFLGRNWGLNSGLHTPVHCVLVILEVGSWEVFAQAGLKPQFSASQIARITGVSHQHHAGSCFLIQVANLETISIQSYYWSVYTNFCHFVVFCNIWSFPSPRLPIYSSSEICCLSYWHGCIYLLLC